MLERLILAFVAAAAREAMQTGATWRVAHANADMTPPLNFLAAPEPWLHGRYVAKFLGWLHTVEASL